ncbi:MAG: hypothetical protein ACRDG3_04445, partial [Tepidiformaceae bacterium]
PLIASEIEAGTFRLVWTQSVTRTRWLAVKLCVLGIASIAIAGLVSWMVTWWAGPLDRAHMDAFATFDQRDIVALGYGAFAFALGVTAGMLIRRTLPAMATTAVLFIAARVAFAQWVRPHLIAPVHLTFALNTSTVKGFVSRDGGPPTLTLNPPQLTNAWIYSTTIVDKAGHALTQDFLGQACSALMQGLGPGLPGLGKGPNGVGQPTPGKDQAFQTCVTKVGEVYHGLATYQPANRYWTFQWYEMAIFLGFAVVLSGFCLWWVRHRMN